MRICAVIKYPPIQGGVSAQSYWLARGLAEAGHTVDVVTNAHEVEDRFRILFHPEDLAWLETETEAGGRVRLHQTEPFSPKFTHIPQSNPFVSKLAGMATDVVRRHDSEVIFSYYLEPYGVAAHLASLWTGVPHVVRHAGSDLGRLMDRIGNDTTYSEIFRRADGVCVGNPYVFLGMGAKLESIYRTPPFGLPTAHFSPQAEPLDLPVYIQDIAERYPGAVTSPGPLDSTRPTIGIYGKMGEVKGSFDLLAALGRLRQEGLEFNFVAVSRGHEMDRYRQSIRDHDLSEVTWILPFMPHWRVPRFLRACDAVCFLERDFPIVFHTPTIPREILACGTCMILSGEIQRKQPYREGMADGENFLLVDDPKVHDDLAAALRKVIEDPQAAAEIGRRGVDLVAELEERHAGVAVFETLFTDVLRRRAGETTQVSREDRGLARDRAEELRRLVYPLASVLGDEHFKEALDQYFDATPEAPGGPFEDALALCASLRGRTENEMVLNTLRYAERILWLGHMRPDELEQPRFDHQDVLPTLSNVWRLENLSPLSPCLGRWVEIERFQHLPEALMPNAPEGEESGERWVVFHKLPSLNGHHFGINAFAAGLLERCDGERNFAELVRLYRDSSGQPPQSVARSLAQALRRFYRAGLIIFADRRP